MSAREEVLARIRTALGGTRAPVPEIVRGYRTTDDRPLAELLDVLVDRLEDYQATVLRCGPSEVEPTVAAALHGALGGTAPGGVVVAPGVPADWRPDGVVEDYERVVDQVDLASIAARERITRHDVKARIEEFSALAGHEHIHKGMTSRDLTENV